jgi:hypothetical protein
MATKFGAYGITELRRYASEYKIVGRSKMDGWELLAECRNVWHARRDAKQNAVILAGPVEIGTKLRFVDHPGCVIVATSELLSLDGSLYVHGEYVSRCRNCEPYRRSVDMINRSARGEGGNAPYLFFLYLLEHVPAEPAGTDGILDLDKEVVAELVGDRVEIGADGCGCPITEQVTVSGASVEGTERTEHRSSCWLSELVQIEEIPISQMEPAQRDEFIARASLKLQAELDAGRPASVAQVLDVDVSAFDLDQAGLTLQAKDMHKAAIADEHAVYDWHSRAIGVAGRDRDQDIEDRRTLVSLGFRAPDPSAALFGEQIVPTDNAYWATHDLAVWRLTQEWTGDELIERQGRAMLALI